MKINNYKVLLFNAHVNSYVSVLKLIPSIFRISKDGFFAEELYSMNIAGKLFNLVIFTIFIYFVFNTIVYNWTGNKCLSTMIALSITVLPVITIYIYNFVLVYKFCKQHDYFNMLSNEYSIKNNVYHELGHFFMFHALCGKNINYKNNQAIFALRIVPKIEINNKTINGIGTNSNSYGMFYTTFFNFNQYPENNEYRYAFMAGIVAVSLLDEEISYTDFGSDRTIDTLASIDDYNQYIKLVGDVNNTQIEEDFNYIRNIMLNNLSFFEKSYLYLMKEKKIFYREKHLKHIVKKYFDNSVFSEIKDDY